MSRYSLLHFAHSTVRHDLLAACSRGRFVTADILALIAEFDSRKLYLEDGYHSMHAYCMGELRFSEDSAYKRIQAARTARRFPVLFEAVADGRLHLSAVCMLAPHLTEANLAELVTAATHRSKAKIELMLAQRFPRPDVPTRVRAIPAPAQPPAHGPLAPGQVGVAVSISLGGGEDRPSRDLQLAPGQVGAAVSVPPGGGEDRPGHELQLAPGQVGGTPQPGAPSAPEHGPGHVASEATLPTPPSILTPRPRITPLAPRRYALTVTIDESTQSKLIEAQELLSHTIAPGDIAAVLDRALELLVGQLRKRKFAATSKPREAQTSCDRPSDPRSIPAHVKRIVWARDGGQCTFKSPTGHRCEARSRLEFDHRVEVARGGEASVSNIRLRCRAHNQFTAAQALGAELVSARRRAAIEAREKAKLRAAAETATVREAMAQVLGAGTADAARSEPVRR